MSKAPALPLFCGDYLAATVGLSLEQSGAFLHILMAIWAGGGKPIADDDEFLARICRVTRERWQKKLRPALAPLFDLSNGTWRNVRLEKEWEYVQQRIAAQRANGAKGGRPPKNGPNGPNLPTENRKENRQSSEDKSLKYNDTAKPNGYVSQNPIESTLPNYYTYHVEDTLTPVDPIKPSPPLRGGGEPRGYVGKSFNLNAKTVDEWRLIYHGIPDLTAALRMLDDDLAGRKPDQVHGALRARLHGMHQSRLEARAAKQPQQKPHTNRAGIRRLGGSNAA